MPVRSPVHPLCNAEPCHADIQTLRWTDRPLQCPRCQSDPSGRWGTYPYRPGCQRAWCPGCTRTFNDRTAPLRPQSPRSLSPWMLATFVLCLACSSRRMARAGGGHLRTS